MVKVAFVGAGGIHFGSIEGPWNHSARLERLDDVEFTAIVDINLSLAKQRLDDRKANCPHKWDNACVFSNYIDMLNSPSCPDCVFIGLPPNSHGVMEPISHSIELECARRKISIFIDKPISIAPVDEVKKLANIIKSSKIICSVGYMLRYSGIVSEAMRQLKTLGVIPRAIIARYYSAYSEIRKKEWWDIRDAGGPIVEQATHFADLIRYFGGEIIASSIAAVAVSPKGDDLVDMKQMNSTQGEHGVPYEYRINRATSANFLFESGCIGSLTHSFLLHGTKFITEFEIISDGVRCLIEDPYGDPRLFIRTPVSESMQEIQIDRKRDMYFEELVAFINAVKTGDSTQIKSSFEDALKSYELTKLIAERSKTSS